MLPEKLSCIAVDNQGVYCAGATAQGRIYVWEVRETNQAFPNLSCSKKVASGIMYSSWDAHYRQINVLTFTRDGAALLSGSEDSGVSVWSVSRSTSRISLMVDFALLITRMHRLLNDDTQDELPLPYCSLSDHTLPVTDIVCGIGNFPLCRVITSSMDHSVKVRIFARFCSL